MADQSKAQTAAESKSPVQDPSAELSRLRKENAEMSTRLQAFEREAELMRSALDTARDEGRLGGLPKGAVQLAESVTIVQGGKMIDARPGDVLVPDGASIEAIRKTLPTGVRAFVTDKVVIDEVRARKLVRA